MDKELKGIVVEIIAIVVLLLIVIPICAHASSEYISRRDALLIGNKASVDISSNGEYKKIRVTSGVRDSVKVNLFMKISKFNDDYIIYLDDKSYDLRELECTEDENYQYYNLGTYEIEKEKLFQFKINVKDKSYYDETISYGFYTQGIM